MPSDDLVVRVADTDDVAAVASLRLAWGDGAHDDEIRDFERHLFVPEDRRNRGIGSALIRAVIDAARERRYVRVVLSPTGRSVPFYRRAGFVAADGEAGGLLLLRPNPLS